MCDINSKLDVIICRTKGCLYKICSKPQYHHIIDNLNYYKRCVEASKSSDETNGVDNDGFEHKFDVEYNEDCVFTFWKTRDDNDVASIDEILLSIACNTVFDKLSEILYLKILTRFLVKLYF